MKKNMVNKTVFYSVLNLHRFIFNLRYTNLSVYILPKTDNINAYTFKLNTMNIKGKLIAVLLMQIGNCTNGQWKKQDIIIETDMQHPKKICVSIYGDKINES